MSEDNTIARPYVQAAFEVAQKQADLKGWSVFIHTLSDLMANADIRAVVSSPRIKRDQIEALILELAGVLNKEQSNFVRVLAQGGRLTVAAEIAEMFEVLRAEAEKSAQVTISSAFVLNDVQQEKIAAALKVRLGCDIKLSCDVNKALLGGIVIRMGDKVIDGSANTRLAELAYALA
ncbi:MAG: F0F1 ATP synthase subunit delta [Gallionella sp.]|nr:F0F1 ATP synthase subunit delta [Gallionella sp.]